MILNIPTSADFEAHGIDFLNLSWSMILDVLDQLKDACHHGYEKDDFEADFWSAAQRELSTALSLVEQGAEFLLKSKICAYSPWLLISKDPKDWPRKCDKGDVHYSAFRTIDAQDLIKIHNTFLSPALDEDFGTIFEKLRMERNSVMHTVDRSVNHAAEVILEHILLISEYLIGSQKWVATRRKFLSRDRYAIFDPNGEDYRIAGEFVIVRDLLLPQQLKRFFGFNKRQRAYCCPRCSFANKNYTIACRTASLHPNTPASTILYCFVCNSECVVERNSCDTCKGNVIDAKTGTCLSCVVSDI